MKEVIINQCDFCKRVSFHKSSVRRHEKKCFQNPATRSCVTCLWFSSPNIEHGYPAECFLGKIEKVPEGSKIKVFTQCEKYIVNFSSIIYVPGVYKKLLYNYMTGENVHQ
jgi:hypothetical protein